ncbi:MAG: cytidylate kinase family protein [Candidatus Micrarchaeaceae archaeon]
MKICIGGFASSGKTTFGEALARELNVRHIHSTYKGMVNNDDRSIIKLLDGLTAKHDKKTAKSFDSEVVKESDKGDCVISTWLGAWIVKDATVRVWLDATQEERAKRRAHINNMKKMEALEFIKAYDAANIKYFKDVYKIDVTDHSIFDIALNTERMHLDEMVGIVSLLAAQRDVNRFG